MIYICSIILIFGVTWGGGFFPFFKKYKARQVVHFPNGESIAAGVFLGVGLLHMLGDASKGFYGEGIYYPVAFLLAGGMFFVLLSLEHIGQEIYRRGEGSGPIFAFLATLMLSIHSLLTGIALGLSHSFSIVVILLLAILAHKWAESFALAVQIQKSSLGMKSALILFSIFSLMVPVGIVCGRVISNVLDTYFWIQPVFSSLAAGTFLYLGTLHGLERATLITHCCGLKRFLFVIIGFALMAVVAIWT